MLAAACCAVVSAAIACANNTAAACQPMSIGSSGGADVNNSAAVAAAPFAFAELACRCHRPAYALNCISIHIIGPNIGVCTVVYRAYITPGPLYI